MSVSQYVPPYLRSASNGTQQHGTQQHGTQQHGTQQHAATSAAARNPFRSNRFSVLEATPVATVPVHTAEAFPVLSKVNASVPGLASTSAKRVVSFADCLQGRKPTKPVRASNLVDQVAPGWVRLKPWKVGPARKNSYLEREAVMAPIRLGRALFRKRVLRQLDELEQQNTLLGDLSPYWGMTYEDIFAVYEEYMKEDDEYELDDNDEADDQRVGLESATAEPALETV